MKTLKPLFFILIFLIPFENYKLELGNLFSLRPYQVAAVLLLVFVAYFYFKGKIKTDELLIPFRPPVSKLLAVYFVVSLASLVNSPDLKNGFQETIVLLSFLFIYWLVIFFIKNKDDVKNLFYVILSSGLFAAVFGLIQAVVYKTGLEFIEVMPGRPNSILPEPDWFGFFMVFVLAVLVSSRFIGRQKIAASDVGQNVDRQPIIFSFLGNRYFSYVLELLFYISIILTIARASWLAAIAVIGLYLLLTFLDKENRFTLAFSRGVKVLLIFAVSLGIIYAFNLTPFPLKNRLLSIVTRQEIHAVTTDPKTGKEISIAKEDIESYKKRGIEVKEKKVDDVNILRRTESFTNSSDIILRHPLLGIGYGGIETYFGEGVNANNIFMEIWAATGIIGLIVFSLIFYCIFRDWLFYYFKKINNENRVYLFFVILGFAAIIIPNIFNSGLFLGFFWVYLGVASSLAGGQLKTIIYNL